MTSDLSESIKLTALGKLLLADARLNPSSYDRSYHPVGTEITLCPVRFQEWNPGA